MNTYWKIETHGDPIGAIQNFVRKVWQEAKVDRMLISANGEFRSHMIEDPDALAQVNPFRPLMKENLAQKVPQALQQHPDSRLGALLRPCEMRALLEIDRRQPLSKDRLLTLCVDCLGTFPLEEYEWRASKKSAQAQLAGETLQFARQGGILAYRYRAACQMCSNPGARSADLNIHVLGLPVRERILIEARNGGSLEYLDLASLTSGSADPESIQQHQHVITRQTNFHHQTFDRLLEALDELLPKDVDQLIQQLDNCQDCQRCMSVCPICAAEFPRRDAEGHYPRWTIQRWLVSCAGCGMCEQVCKDNLPLGVIFGSIREKLRAELSYIPRDSWEETIV